MKPCFVSKSEHVLLGSGQMLMVCPVCEFYFVHLDGSEPTENGIRIRASCEEGHAFTVTLRFHEGHVYIESQRLPDTGIE